MIIDKKNKQVISGNQSSILADASKADESEVTEVPEQIAANGPIDVLTAIKEILRSVTWQYGVANSPKIFKTVQVDDGQYERIISPDGNMEETIAFPAAFIHFINWRYLVDQTVVNEGRAEMRIRFILNSLNVHEDGHDMDIYYVAERINQTIKESISSYECLQERCRLTYIDPMESFDNGLQPCWMTYEVWFKQRNISHFRKVVFRKLVCPPFTNHADQDQSVEGVNLHNHTNLDHPRKYDEATGYQFTSE